MQVTRPWPRPCRDKVKENFYLVSAMMLSVPALVSKAKASNIRAKAWNSKVQAKVKACRSQGQGQVLKY